jgi:hypothetical protein
MILTGITAIIIITAVTIQIMGAMYTMATAGQEDGMTTGPGSTNAPVNVRPWAVAGIAVGDP